MSAKGYTGLSDAAERHISNLVGMGWSPENARKMVEQVVVGERNRIIASIRGRWSRRCESRASHMTDVAEVQREVVSMLDELESAA